MSEYRMHGSNSGHAALSIQALNGGEHEELFRRLVESVRDYAIFMLDPAGRVATWNLGAQRIKGYRAEEIIGKNFSVFYPDDVARGGKCEFELEEAARIGRFEDEGWRVRKDGTLFWANVVITAVHDDRGRLLGFAKVTRDLTEGKKAEEDRAARLAAEQANKVKDEFLAMLGHELRNPLAPILTALELMKRHGDHGPSREREIIDRQVKQMMRLIDDLLDVSRIAKGKIALKKQRVDLREVLARAVEAASPLLEQRRHHLEIDAPDYELVVNIDDARMTQVLANLLVNAAKYTPPGGHIDVDVQRSSEEVVIEVRDDGCGIAADLLPRIFDLFVQGHPGAAPPTGGLGIGLTLVRTLVGMHGGKVEVQSAGEGMGTTFTVRLPVPGPDVVVPRSKSRPTIDGSSPKGPRILLVDDNKDAALLLAEVLSDAGHQVKIAYDAAQALEAVKDFEPNVAILDIGLPVIDGYQLALRLRAQLGPKTPRLIALSGYGQQNDRERSDWAGFDAHLVKPTDTAQLMETILDAQTRSDSA